jgi:hypothetical protein
MATNRFEKSVAGRSLKMLFRIIGIVTALLGWAVHPVAGLVLTGIVVWAFWTDYHRPCPACRKQVHQEATICPYCRSSL